MNIDFIIPDSNGSLMDAYQNWRQRADQKVNCDYAMHCAITVWNDKIRKEMADIVNEGVTSFKCFMAYKGTSLMRSDEDLYEVFERCKELGALPMVHAENGDLVARLQERIYKSGVTGPEGHYLSRPDEIEGEATYRAITIADSLTSPLYVVHVMKRSAAEAIQRAKAKGMVVFGEPVATSLAVDASNLWDPDWRKAAGNVMSPIMDIDPTTKDYLMKMLQSGSLDTTGSDNCTFNAEQKGMGREDFRKIPNGCNGLEDRMHLIWEHGVVTGKLDLTRFVAVTSTNAAKVFNCYPRKGVIQQGSDADVVIWDPKVEHVISKDTHHHNLDFNTFEG